MHGRGFLVQTKSRCMVDCGEYPPGIIISRDQMCVPLLCSFPLPKAPGNRQHSYVLSRANMQLQTLLSKSWTM